MLVQLKRFWLQIGLRCLQAAPPCVVKKPERFTRQFAVGCALGRVAQRGVKGILRFARVAQHQETKAIKLRQILFSIRHA